MFPSLKSSVIFIYINGILLSIGSIEYLTCFLVYYYYYHQIVLFLGLLSIYSIRNYLLIYLIEQGTLNKKNINDRHEINERYYGEFHLSLITTTSIETLTHMYIYSYMAFRFDLSYSILYDLVMFIPISFLFEILFDFFHYWGHRILHHPLVYIYSHKIHHRFLRPKAITTFYQDPIDLFITNSVPTFLGMSMIPYMSHLLFHWIIIYKNFIEISGHCGKISYPSSSFPQCVWLPRILGIELYTENHDMHHSINNCNYAKRFSLWDKVFGTYRQFQYETVK